MNWVLCAAAYVERVPDDHNWLVSTVSVFKAAFTSLSNRDHPDADQRDGLMSADSSRCAGGQEITTYDSLDTSLGQARDNVYLGGKTWAAYVALERLFQISGLQTLSQEAGAQAERAAATMADALTADGHIPAVLKGGSGSRIIPAIEGLVYPLFTGAAPGAALELGRAPPHPPSPGGCATLAELRLKPPTPGAARHARGTGQGR